MRVFSFSALLRLLLIVSDQVLLIFHRRPNIVTSHSASRFWSVANGNCCSRNEISGNMRHWTKYAPKDHWSWLWFQPVGGMGSMQKQTGWYYSLSYCQWAGTRLAALWASRSRRGSVASFPEWPECPTPCRGHWIHTLDPERPFSPSQYEHGKAPVLRMSSLRTCAIGLNMHLHVWCPSSGRDWKEIVVTNLSEH